MKNDRDINLISGSRINLIGNLGFVVSNSADMRFYPSDMIPMEVSTEVTSETPAPTHTEATSETPAPTHTEATSDAPYPTLVF